MMPITLNINAEDLTNDEDFAMLKKAIELQKAAETRSRPKREILSDFVAINNYFNMRIEQEWSHYSLWDRARYRLQEIKINLLQSFAEKLCRVDEKLENANHKRKEELEGMKDSGGSNHE